MLRLLGVLALIFSEVWQLFIIVGLGWAASDSGRSDEWGGFLRALFAGLLIIPVGYLAAISGTRLGSWIAIICAAILAVTAIAVAVTIEEWEGFVAVGLPAGLLALGVILVRPPWRGPIAREATQPGDGPDDGPVGAAPSGGSPSSVEPEP